MDLVDTLDQTFQHAQQIIAGVRPEQYDDKTPCTEWTVRDLLNHEIGVVAGLGAAATGTPRDTFTLGADPAGQFAEAAAAALAAWRTPGVMDRTLDAGAGPMPGHVLASINLVDTATHTWDLAKATDQPAKLPDDVAVAALDAGRMIITSPEMRGGRFGPEVLAPDGADATDRLVAFLGRTP
jgi:uncharacterized protein (TIGR03086 family)